MSKRKIVSLLMAFMMIFTLIPASVFADETEAQSGVVINVAPSTANVTFYEGENAESVLDASKVTDNGIVDNYHQYVLNVDKGMYSYRGVDTLGTEDTSDDTYFFAPYVIGSMGMYYNETVIDNALGKGNWKVPNTTDELVALCKRLQERSNL